MGITDISLILQRFLRSSLFFIKVPIGLNIINVKNIIIASYRCTSSIDADYSRNYKNIYELLIF